MIEMINLKARWGARKESVEECATRTLQCLKQLSVCDEVFAQTWLKCGMSLKEALANKVELTIESLRNLLAKGRNRRDFTKSMIEELGFYPGRLWNGRSDQDAAHVSIHCGAYPDLALMPGPNDVLVEFPYEGPVAERVLQVDKLRQIVAAVVSSWDTDWARVSTYQMDEAIYPQQLYRGQQVGWLTYVSDRYGPLPVLPQECDVTRIGALGSLIVIASVNKVTASNPTHIMAVRHLSEILKNAGMLTPIPPEKCGNQ